MQKRDGLDYFAALLQLADAAKCMFDAEGEETVLLLAHAQGQYRRIKDALVREYVPPMERGDIVSLARRLYCCAEQAACGAAEIDKETQQVRELLCLYAENIFLRVELLPRFRKAEAFAKVLQRGDVLYGQLCEMLLRSDTSVSATFRALVRALWQAGETVEAILIKYA